MGLSRNVFDIDGDIAAEDPRRRMRMTPAWRRVAVTVNRHMRAITRTMVRVTKMHMRIIKLRHTL